MVEDAIGCQFAPGASPLTYVTPLSNSPLRNAGLNSLLTALGDPFNLDADSNTTEGVPFDVVFTCNDSGFPSFPSRISDSVIDIGAVEATCGADFNLDGAVNVPDVFDFLNAWFANCTAPGAIPCYQSADYNGGGLSVSDIFDFLNDWFAPC